MLLTFVSCVKQEITKSQKCTINDVKVDCSTLKVKSGTAQIKTAIHVDYENNVIEFLENASDEVQVQTLYGMYECSVTVYNGLQFEFQKSGTTLTLSHDGTSFDYKQTAPGAGGINGTWSAKVREKSMTIQSVIQISNDNKAVMKATCSPL